MEIEKGPGATNTPAKASKGVFEYAMGITSQGDKVTSVNGQISKKTEENASIQVGNFNIYVHEKGKTVSFNFNDIDSDTTIEEIQQIVADVYDIKQKLV